MQTRCPKCATTFRITPEQLKAKQGRVRCGQCQTVFNAIETLAEAKPSTGDAIMADKIGVPHAGHFMSPAPTFAPTALDITPAEAMTEVPAPQAGEAPATVAVEPPSQPATVDDDEAVFDTLLPEEAPARRWPWAIGATFALLGLGAQAAFHFRTELAVLVPEAKPAMLELCAALDCDLPLPRKADLISIEASDLHPEPANPNRLQLAASLKNRAPFAQAHPHLELTLTDTADKALVRRVFAPADYLPKTRPTPQAFAAASDLAINLALEVKDAAPVGYRLYVFYP